jgi:toxin FitB
MQLVDTNVISEFSRQSPDLNVLAWRQSCQLTAPKLTISAITLDEVAFGISRRPSARLMNWLDSFTHLHEVLPISEAIARRAGEMRAQLDSVGVTRSQADMLIAATAQIHGLTLVTRNVSDFEGCGIAVLNPFRSIPGIQRHKSNLPNWGSNPA